MASLKSYTITPVDLDTPSASSSTNANVECYVCKSKGLPSQTLKRCSRCLNRLYCSQACQSKDWKDHKVECNKSKAAKSNPIKTPFDGLVNDTFLHNIPEKEAFAKIVDCHRLRLDDEVNWLGRFGGIYSEEGEPLRDFHVFLDKAEQKGVMPPWWNKDKRQELEKLAMSKDYQFTIHEYTEKSEVQDDWKNPTMPMKLRMLAEKINGKSLMSGP